MMRNTSRARVIGTVLILASTILSAQEPNASTRRLDTMRAKFQTSPYDSLLKSQLHQYGLTEEKLDKLKQIGLDVKECIIREEKDDPGFDASLCDLVIIGKVLDVIAMPGMKSKPFHSKASIQVIEVLKGPPPAGKTLELVSESGPITNNRDSVIGDVYVTSAAEFQIGETSAFFLKNIFTDPSFAPNHQSLFTNDTPDFIDPTYHVHPQSKFQILDSTVTYRGQRIPLGLFISRVKKVSHIVDSVSSH